MKVLPWVLVALLSVTVLVLGIKVYLMRKSARQLREGMAQRLAGDTSTLLTLSSGDSQMRQLAHALNEQLVQLWGERCRLQQGDLELKEAITNISHDLRTPLTAIYGYLDLLEGEEMSQPVARYLSQISNRTQAMGQLTEELFRYSVVTSVQELHPETVDLRGLLEEALLSYCGAMEQRGMVPTIQLPEGRVERSLAPPAPAVPPEKMFPYPAKQTATPMLMFVDKLPTLLACHSCCISIYLTHHTQGGLV